MMKGNYCHLILLGILSTQEVEANQINIPDFNSPIQQELFLDVILNQSDPNVLGRFLQKDDQLFVFKDTLQQLKLNLPTNINASSAEYYLLEDIPFIDYNYDSLNQKIYFNVDIRALNKISQYTAYNIIEPAKLDPVQDRPGVLLNYDFYSQYSEDYFSLNGTNEFRLFGLGEGGILSVSSNYSYTHTNQNSELNALVLDTYWQRDFPEKMLTIRIGDVQSKSLAWSRSTRLGGVSFSKNFSLQPYQITTPLESFKGEVSLPSTVDLFINGLKQTSQQVVPGQFEIETVPIITGTGQAQVIVTDINGQQRILNFSLYGTNQLLKDKLSDWSFSLGQTRLAYGEQSFKYDDDLVGNASYRYGLTKDLTIESHIEFAPDLYLIGGGVIQRLGGRAGMLNAAYSFSDYRHSNETLYQLGYSWNSQYLNFFYNTTRQSGQYYDIAGLNSSNFPKRSDQVFLGFNNRLGQFGTSYIYQEYSPASSNEFITFNWSYSFPNNYYLNLSANHDLTQEDTRYYLSLNIPLEKKRTVNFSYQQDQEQEKLSLNARQAISRDVGGWGWQLQADTARDTQNIQAQIAQMHDYGEWNIGFQEVKSKNISSRIANSALSGSVLMMNQSFFPMQRSFDSFALISTSQISDIPVKLENRYVGKTNKNGELVVTSLNPYQNNRITIDPLELPPDYHIETTVKNAVPRYASGVFLEFPISQILAIQAVIKQANGNFIKAGTNVWATEDFNLEDTGPLTIVAHDGMIYIENPKANKFYLKQNDQICSFEIKDLSDQKGIIDLGELICE
ncbi:fimbrial biogenesis outer membrane usher protein [Acinetobacter sp. T_3_1]|nr:MULTISPECIES: fimbria/pilus outer membrane usher protein [unclassified Acinetobacter]MCT8090495.1 fimbrial biogenesis outer membrane usher protein [Acinetobacter sp. F_3_1]MCT8098107.1 fimbrial biogenesis outer membrane usher protein [Acinetobacter sp. C_3_1]MCT8134490.1 fimbrial biogenesis outer membrane usher protein [Acinetobacter sp. T_3_1]